MTHERDIMADILLASSQVPALRLWRQNAGRWLGVPPSYLPKLRRAGIPFSWIQGAPAGACDLTGILGGRRVEVEVKTERGKQSEEQKDWEKMIRSQGGVFVLARSVPDFLGGLP